MSPLTFSLLLSLIAALSSTNSISTPCNELCGSHRLPFPFHLDPACGPPIPTFRLTCVGNRSLYLSLPLEGGQGTTTASSDLLRVISFLPSSSSLLLDYSRRSSPSLSPCDRWYSDVGSHLFDSSPFLSVTAANLLRLYDCEDSSVCRDGCDDGGCESATSRGCCYPLADGSVWKVGDGFGVFREYGCRGFSSWVDTGGGGDRSDRVERGIEMEWALPPGFRNGTECADGAVLVNATAVKGGVRCACRPGFVGDGFAAGSGCFRSCGNDGNATYDDGDCCKGRLCQKKLVVVVGLLVSVFFISAAVACYFLLRSPSDKRYRWDSEQTCLPKIFARACRTRLFTYQELNEATKRFNQDHKLEVVDGTVHPGVLCDGSLVAVQSMRCENQQNLSQALDRVELLSHISHKNIARMIGWCISSGYTLLLVHEFFPNGTLKELLQPGRENGPLSWYRRINIATEVASALAHLQAEVSPPIKPHNIKSSDIFILPDYSVKIGSFKLLTAGSALVSQGTDVVYNFGLILLELIIGSKHDGVEEVVLAKVKDGRLHECVDPHLRFGEQLPVQREQIEKLATFAVHCLSRRGLCIVGTAKEFIRIVNDSNDSLEPSLEVTFSDSSLLQMISVSPDSLHAP